MTSLLRNNLNVENSGVPPAKYPTSELIRRKNTGQPLEDQEEKNKLPRGKNTWPGNKYK